MNNKTFNGFLNTRDIKLLVEKSKTSGEIKKIGLKTIEQDRLTSSEAQFLYNNAETGFLALLADYKNHISNGNKVYFNKNIHIEPTNVCVYNCKFCSYSRRPNDKESWIYSLEDIMEIARKYKEKEITEIHMVGGVHPDWDIDRYCKMVEVIKQELPDVNVKAYTAVEISYISKKAGITVKETLQKLKQSGLDSMPGGGAEIFNPEIRRKICADKCTSTEWLEVHRNAHELGIPTNATILYGHLESYTDRIDHMEKIRQLQDETGGFNTFIPLKYRLKNNILNITTETSVVEDLRNYAITRIFLDNFKHIKAYWPMIGRHTAQLSLSFGVDDLDGTIDDTTKIYTMAGVEEKKPAMSTSEMVGIIQTSGKIAVERDTFYNEVKIYNS